MLQDRLHKEVGKSTRIVMWARLNLEGEGRGGSVLRVPAQSLGLYPEQFKEASHLETTM